jgi:hypothetical protein
MNSGESEIKLEVHHIRDFVLRYINLTKKRVRVEQPAFPEMQSFMNLGVI